MTPPIGAHVSPYFTLASGAPPNTHSATFNGTSQYITWGDGTTHDPQSVQFGVSWWMKGHPASGNAELIWSNWDNNVQAAQQAQVFAFNVGGTARIYSLMWNTPGSTGQYWPVTNDGAWHHYIFQNDFSLSQTASQWLYEDNSTLGNGTLWATGAADGSALRTVNATAGNWIAASKVGAGAGFYYGGQLDEICTYDNLLDGTARTAIFDAPPTAATPNIYQGWTMDDDPGRNVTIAGASPVSQFLGQVYTTDIPRGP